MEFVQPGRVKLEPEDVCCTPNGWICVANRTNVLVLNASDGAMVFFLDEGYAFMRSSDIHSMYSKERAQSAIDATPDGTKFFNPG